MKRKWHCQMRTNGSINIVETDLTGNQRVAFNLRDIGEKDALKISIAREMFDLLKDISWLQESTYGHASELHVMMISKARQVNELLETVNQEIL